MNAAQTQRRAHRFPAWQNILACGAGGFAGVELGNLARTFVQRFPRASAALDFASTSAVVALAPILLKIFGG